MMPGQLTTFPQEQGFTKRDQIELGLAVGRMDNLSVVGWFAACYGVSWWRHQMEIFSALLAICAGNSPVTGEFPTQRPVTQSFDVYFDLRPKERLSKQWCGWWFETLSRSLWRHRNVNGMRSMQNAHNNQRPASFWAPSGHHSNRRRGQSGIYQACVIHYAQPIVLKISIICHWNDNAF